MARLAWAEVTTAFQRSLGQISHTPKPPRPTAQSACRKLLPYRLRPNLPGTTHSYLTDSFTLKAEILKFDLKKIPIPRKREAYNDDVKIQHFRRSDRHHAGKQRRGVIDEHLECLSLADRVEADLLSPFFLSLSTPLPDSILSAVRFIRDCGPALIRAFWDDQLSKLDDLAGASVAVEAKLYDAA